MAAAPDASVSECMRVMARVRPVVHREGDGVSLDVDPDSRTLRVATAVGRVAPHRFDAVLSDEASQEDMFAEVQPVLVDALSGYNCAVFAYGQTGTGKTYTMLGTDFWAMAMSEGAVGSSAAARERSRAVEEAWAAPHRWGIIPRAMDFLFQRLEGNRSAQFKVVCQYLEIYNERVFDLLVPKAEDWRTTPGLELRQPRGGSGDGGVVVAGATQVPITCCADVLQVLWEGACNRVLAATDMNEHSSRSHTIFRVSIEQRTSASTPSAAGAGAGGASGSGGGPGVVIRSTVSLVDLAGSEKIRPHQVRHLSQRRLAELTSINQSLSTLGNCIRALSDSERTHVPYRDSKLTRLLQDSLGGNTKTSFIVTLSPAAEAAEETLSTLQFADRAARVRVFVQVNETLDDPSVLRAQAEEIARLKRLLAEATRGGGSGAGSSADHAVSAAADAAEEEVVRLQADNVALANTLKAVQAQLAAVRRDRDAVVAATHGADSDVLAARAAALDQRQAAVEAMETEQAKRTATLNRFQHALCRLPLDGSPELDAGAPPDALPDAPGAAAMTWRQRLRMLELTVRLLLKDLQRSRRAFAAEVLRVQTAAEQAAATAAAAATATAMATATATATSPATKAHAPTPIGADGAAAGVGASQWQQFVDDDSRRSYYYNTATGETTWTRPPALDAAPVPRDKLLPGLKALSDKMDDAVKGMVTRTSAAVRRATPSDAYHTVLEALTEQAVTLRHDQDTAVALFAAELGLR